MADKLVLVNPFWWNTICSLLNALFIRCFKLIYTARVIDCKHRSQWRHQQILHSTVPYGRGIWEKESIIGVQWFQKNLNPRVHRSVGNSASLVSHWNGGPSGWDFSVPTEHQWCILFILCAKRWFSIKLSNSLSFILYNIVEHIFQGWRRRHRILFEAIILKPKLLELARLNEPPPT